jgi:hypothetical protein
MTRRKEAGQTLVFTAIGLVALMGFMGLAVDVGVMRVEKRLQQTAADSAAIAAASNLAYSGWQAGGQAAAVANGFTDSSSNDVASCTASGATIGTICVELDSPPADGPHSGQADYVEARVAAVRPTYFMQLLGIPSESVTARAVATDLGGGGPNSGCLYTLGPPSSSIEGVNINGNATLNGPSCGIVDNGNFNTKGNSLNVTAGTFGIAGAWDKSGPGGTVTCTASSNCPTTSAPASGDPLAGITPPCAPCSGGSPAVAVKGVFSPGTYSSISVGPGTYTFSPGTYIVDGSGGLSIGANATVSGTGGVMFYFTNGATLNMAGTPNVNLTGLSSGQYAGILFYQDPNDTAGPVITGNASNSYDGVLYFPKANVTFQGNSSIGDVAIVIADALTLSGHPTVNLQGIAGLPAGTAAQSVLKSAILVE